MASVMDMKRLETFLKTLNIEEKSLLNTNYARIPELFIKLWYKDNNPLVVDVPKIMEHWGEDAMKRFIKHVKLDTKEYLRFSLDHIKEIFYILAKPVHSLWYCEILPTGSYLGRIQEWELLTIPEFMPDLLNLTLHIDVSLNFVVQFNKLSFLTLYKSISSHNMNEILTNCKLLSQLNLVSDKLSISLDANLLTGITSLALSINMFKLNTGEVLKLENIKTLSITYIDESNTNEWVTCVNYYMEHTPREISLLILSGSNKPKFDFNAINFSDIEQIMIADFPTLDDQSVIKMLKKHPKIRFLLFNNCPKLSVSILKEIDDILQSLLITDFSIYFKNCPSIEASLLDDGHKSERLTIEEEVDLPQTFYQSYITGVNIAEFHYFEEEPTISSVNED